MNADHALKKDEGAGAHDASPLFKNLHQHHLDGETAKVIGVNHKVKRLASATAKLALKDYNPHPSDVAELALLNIADVCTAVRMSSSWVHSAVSNGTFPQPLRHGPRCTRWRSAAVKKYLVERAAAFQSEATEMVTIRAKKASDAAKIRPSATALGESL